MKNRVLKGLSAIGLAVAMVAGGASAYAANTTTILQADKVGAFASVSKPPKESRSQASVKDGTGSRTCNSNWVKGTTSCSIFAQSGWKSSWAKWEYK